MIVQKFGGTSVGGSQQIRRVGEIIQRSLSRKPLVVVSAVGGITDRLIRLGDLALAGAEWNNELDLIVEKHRSILDELSLEPGLVDGLLEELGGLVRGIALIQERTARTQDYLLSFGERLSARIVSAHLRAQGLASTAWDAFDAGLVTTPRHSAARPLEEADAKIREALADRDDVPVVTGFIGKNVDGVITTLGRGGSDYTASIFGAALGADEIQIWTDVDGVMTTDPRIVKTARQQPKLSCAEASELAFYGAKVVHPATMVPAVKNGIPIRVLNTHRPEFEGTLIVADLAPTERGVKSITCKQGISVVSVVAAPMAVQYGFMERIAAAFSNHEIVIDVIATSEVSVAITTKSDVTLEPVVAELESFSEDVTVQQERAVVSLVGEELREKGGVAASVLSVLAQNEIAVEMISFGATRRNLSVVVEQAQAHDAVRVLHSHLFGA